MKVADSTSRRPIRTPDNIAARLTERLAMTRIQTRLLLLLTGALALLVAGHGQTRQDTTPKARPRHP